MDAKRIWANKKLLASIIVIIAIIIILPLAFPTEMKILIYGSDYTENSYGVRVIPSNSDTKYTVYFPFPLNWTISDYLVESEGNSTTDLITENRLVQTYSGPIEKNLVYLVVEGQGDTFVSFSNKNGIGIEMPGSNYPNSDVEIYVETLPTNISIDFILGYSIKQFSPAGLSPETGAIFWGNGTVSENGWHMVDISSIGY